MLDRLEAALERERAFVDDASHELRTPLALHKTELELALRYGASTEELRAAIASAIEEADRLSQLAEYLLVIARSDKGELADRAPSRSRSPTCSRRCGAVSAAAPREAGRSLSIDDPDGLVGRGGPPPRRAGARPTWSRTRLRHGDGPGPPLVPRDRRARSSSTSATPGPGSRPSSCRTRSSASGAPTPPEVGGRDRPRAGDRRGDRAGPRRPRDGPKRARRRRGRLDRAGPGRLTAYSSVKAGSPHRAGAPCEPWSPARIARGPRGP